MREGAAGTSRAFRSAETCHTLRRRMRAIVATVFRWLAWLGGHGNLFIAAALVVVAGTWGFVALTDEVLEGETQHFDDWAVRALRRANDPATPIGPPMRMAVVGSPGYLASRPKVKTPRDLTGHDCINLRFLTHGGLYAWEFEKNGHPLNVRVEGRLIFNNTRHVIASALDGFGLACVPDDIVRAEIASGRLQRVLADWCPPFPGYHLYYPSRRQPSPAFSLLVEALRYRGAAPHR